MENKQQWKKEKGWEWMWTCNEQWPAEHAQEDRGGGINASKYTMALGWFPTSYHRDVVQRGSHRVLFGQDFETRLGSLS